MTARRMGRETTVRVVSYNVHAFKDDREALARVIRALAPDVLCVQEVPRHPFSGHRIAAFAQSVGLLWTAGPRGRMSTSILSSMRLDVRDAGHHALPVVRPDEPRGWAHLTVRLPGYQPLVAASVHLSLRTTDRLRQAELIRTAERFAAPTPMVIAGDINEKCGGPAWAALGAGLVDSDPEQLTFPAAKPDRRIDGVLASEVLRPRSVDVAALASPQDLARASDHRPLCVDLTPIAL
ncbi:endonuclease/exonuclease/phosphatase family protein [Dermacoccaceae bacterium W4C1]